MLALGRGHFGAALGWNAAVIVVPLLLLARPGLARLFPSPIWTKYADGFTSLVGLLLAWMFIRNLPGLSMLRVSS